MTGYAFKIFEYLEQINSPLADDLSRGDYCGFQINGPGKRPIPSLPVWYEGRFRILPVCTPLFGGNIIFSDYTWFAVNWSAWPSYEQACEKIDEIFQKDRELSWNLETIFQRHEINEKKFIIKQLINNQ